MCLLFELNRHKIQLQTHTHTHTHTHENIIAIIVYYDKRILYTDEKKNANL